MPPLFSFRGRISRKAYTIFTILAFAVSIPFSVAADLAMHSLDHSMGLTKVPAALKGVEMSTTLADVIMLTGIVFAVAMLVTIASFNIRRFHDMGLTGWLILVALVITAVVPDIELPGPYLPPLATTIWIVVMMLVPGTTGTNLHGLDPEALPVPAPEVA